MTRNRRHSIIKLLAMGVLYLTAVSCGGHAPPRFRLGEGLLVRVVAGPDNLEPNTPLDVEIRVTNHASIPAHLGDGPTAPWLQVTRIDDIELSDAWIGHGESISPFVLGPGESRVIKRHVRLAGKQPGQYLVQFDAEISDCAWPVFSVPAIVTLRGVAAQTAPSK